MAINIIIPVKDTNPKYFQDCLFSLATQTKKNFLTTIIDDFSTPENSKIYQDLIKQMPYEVNFFRADEHIGPGPARQLGLDMAPTPVDYFMFLDSDDLLYPRAVELLYSEAKVTDADIVAADIFVEGKHRSQDGYIKGGGAVSWITGKAYKRALFEEFDIRFLPRKMYAEDSYFNLITFNFAKKIYTLDEIIYYWRDNSDSATRSDKYNFTEISNFDLFYSQIEGAKKILQYIPDWGIGGIMAILYSCYQYTQAHENKKEIQEMEALLKPWLKRIDIIEKLSLPETQKHTYSKLIQDKDGYIFEETYANWLIRMKETL